jgi:hypothetical protein
MYIPCLTSPWGQNLYPKDNEIHNLVEAFLLKKNWSSGYQEEVKNVQILHGGRRRTAVGKNSKGKKYNKYCYYTSTDFSLYKSYSIKQANFPQICLSTPEQD